MATLDDILRKIGEFGRYQIWLFSLLCLPSMTNGCYMMMMILLAFTPKHRCKIPGYDNDTWRVQGNYHASLINLTIPASDDPFFDYDRCHVYRQSGGNLSYRIMTKCSEYVYAKDIFDETIVTKGDLVCDQGMKPAHAQVVYYVGVMVGDLFFGQLSDSIGRSKTLLITSVLLVASSLGSSFAPEFYSFTVLQFIAGAANHGMFVLVCVLCIEIIGPSKRMITGVSIHVLFPFGLFWIAAAGYIFRNWRDVQLAVGIPSVIFVAYWWWMPESPRWLISQGRYGVAKQVLKKVAERNRTEYPEFDLSKLEQHKPGRMWQLFTTKTLVRRTLIIFLNWFSAAQIYYGVTIHMNNFGGNFYRKFIILAAVEIPAVAFAVAMLTRVGRKKAHAFFMITAGVSCLLTIFTILLGGPSFELVTLALCCLGRLGATAGFSIIYVYSSELFPTVVRNGGMGASSFVARFGSMSAPYIAKVGDKVGSQFGQAIPLIIFGLTALTAGTLTLLLPETLNRRLPDTIKDGERFGKLFEDTNHAHPNDVSAINQEDQTDGCKAELKTLV